MLFRHFDRSEASGEIFELYSFEKGRCFYADLFLLAFYFNARKFEEFRLLKDS